MIYLFKLLLVLIAIVTLQSCGRSDVMTPHEVQNLIEDNLRKGDPRDAIEDFLDKKGWPYSYNRHARRYESGYPEGDKNTIFMIRSTVIWIYIDDNDQFDYVEVEYIHTGI